jgi:hypothetical protein
LAPDELLPPLLEPEPEPELEPLPELEPDPELVTEPELEPTPELVPEPELAPLSEMSFGATLPPLLSVPLPQPKNGTTATNATTLDCRSSAPADGLVMVASFSHLSPRRTII